MFGFYIKIIPRPQLESVILEYHRKRFRLLQQTRNIYKYFVDVLVKHQQSLSN